MGERRLGLWWRRQGFGLCGSLEAGVCVWIGDDGARAGEVGHGDGRGGMMREQGRERRGDEEVEV